ncbi:hypothetical protein ID866_2341 [Astraeus odoratus]|nr:hypothetical protein ID866_2341 [Astraeus odoratus]
MTLYRISFGFREPYQVLVDSEMCRIATESNIDLPKQLSTVLQGEVKLSTAILTSGDTNKHRYVVATQLQPLRSKLRLVPAVPIIHINRAVMILEPPSDKTHEVKTQAEKQALGAPALAKPPVESSNPHRRKKGPKGPNPLSVKKKTVRSTDARVSRNDVATGLPSRDASSAGEKRKRGDDEQPVSTRKRKRRRKHGESAPADATVAKASAG